jgi:hypothetical protein
MATFTRPGVVDAKASPKAGTPVGDVPGFEALTV